MGLCSVPFSLFLVRRLPTVKADDWIVTNSALAVQTAGAGAVDRRCRSRLSHFAGADRGQDQVAGHFRFRPILLKNSGRENSPRISARRCSRQRISVSPDNYQACRSKRSRASCGWSSKRTELFNRIDRWRTTLYSLSPPAEVRNALI